MEALKPLCLCNRLKILQYFYVLRTIPSANNAKAQGVDIYCIGISNKVNEVELREMSSGSQKINEVFVALQHDLSNSFPSSYNIVWIFVQKNIMPNPLNYLSWYDYVSSVESNIKPYQQANQWNIYSINQRRWY